MRQTWDETWMRVAGTIAARSRCDRASVGAVIVDKSNRPIAVGYNGPPRHFRTGVEATCARWCPRASAGDLGPIYGLSCPSIHAESNALLFADRRDYDGGTIYVTRSCCADCAKLIANSGIARVVMRVTPDDAHRDPERVIAFLQECTLDVTVIYGCVTMDLDEQRGK